MHRIARPFVVALVVVVTLGTAGSRVLARQYTLSPVPIGDFDAVLPDDVNNAGQVTGSLVRTGGGLEGMHGYVWSPGGGLTDLGAGLIPSAISDRGAVVGRIANSEPFIWTAAQGARPLSSLPGGAPFRNATANDVNSAGQVLAWTYDGRPGAFVYSPNGTVRVLPMPAQADGLPFDWVEADTITDAGDVIGQVRFVRGDNRTAHGAIWSAAGGVRLLDDVPGGLNSAAASLINGRGEVAGFRMDATGQRPLVWTADGEPIDLGLLPGATFGGTGGINDAGEVVGWSGGTDSRTWHAFVWTGSEGMLDLNNLLDASGAGWSLTDSYGINNSGQILTAGWFDGRYRAALLTPVPEPSALAVFALATAVLMRRRR